MFLIIFLPLLFDEVEVGCFLKPSPFEEGADIIPIKLFISLLLSLSSVLLLAFVCFRRASRFIIITTQMDFETTPKATLFFFFSSSFLLLLFAAL
tara:strand:- start:3417 stop:3701 length:285 start_codon:yes stop_codon:yes gene_type:complete